MNRGAPRSRASRMGLRNGPPPPPTLVAPRMNRGAPRSRASRRGLRNGPHINRPLRCGGDEVLFLVAGGAGEAAVHDLVEQGLVADLQQARGLGPIPVDAL